MNKHLIADNLGWSTYWENGLNGKNNIEEYMDDLGRGDEVNRVSKEVFHLEQTLDSTKSDVNDFYEDENENVFE